MKTAEEFLNEIEKNAFSTNEEIEKLEKHYGFLPIIHIIRATEYMEELEKVLYDYKYEEIHNFYLLEDLKNVAQILSEFSVFSEKTLEESTIFKMKRIAEMYLFPHLKLSKMVGTFYEYTNLVKECRSLFDKIVSLETYSVYKLEIWNILENVSFALEKLGKFTGKALVSTGEVLDSAGEAVVEVTNVVSSIFSLLPVIIIGGMMYFARNLMRHKENPPLLLINPNKDEYKELWNRIKDLDRNISENNFKKGLKIFFNQHGRYPKKEEIINTKHQPGVDLAVMVGKVDNITYIPPSGRKSPYRYKHDMNNTNLATDVTGRHIFLLGDTFLDGKDGWLKN